MNHLFSRYLFFILGLMINSFGIAFITKSALGTTQISSIPYVFSLNFEQISFGMFTFILNMIFLVMQIIILRRDFGWIGFLQIVANIVFSTFIDLSMLALQWLTPETIITRLICLIIGCIILALGISIEVAPSVTMVPGEGIVKAISVVTHTNFGKVKLIFDFTLIIIAVIFSFIFFHGLKGLGIGTIASALLVGPIVSFINARFGLVHYIIRLTGKD